VSRFLHCTVRKQIQPIPQHSDLHGLLKAKINSIQSTEYKQQTCNYINCMFQYKVAPKSNDTDIAVLVAILQVFGIKQRAQGNPLLQESLGNRLGEIFYGLHALPHSQPTAALTMCNFGY